MLVLVTSGDASTTTGFRVKPMSSPILLLMFSSIISSAGRLVVASRGRGIGGRAGSGGSRTKGRFGDQGDGRIDGQDQVGNQGRGQGNGNNQNGDAVNDNIQDDVSRVCTYKEFLACNPKEYDGMVAARERKTIQKAMQIAGTLTNEALRNGLIKKNPEKRGNRGEPSKDMNVRDDNKRTRTGNAFDTTTNPAGNPIARACYECGSTDHIKSACPRLNQAQRPGVNHQNQVMAVNGGQGRGNHENYARGRAFMLGAEEARQDSNIVTGMDWLSDQKTEIICHEKVARMPLLDRKNQEEIVVVRDFLEVFPDNLSGLPPVREIKFRIKLIAGAMPVAKSPYRLAPSKLDELSYHTPPKRKHEV
nr:reverse transcriptase domain-containing protein [Tanacetum cinerariifolium]